MNKTRNKTRKQPTTTRAALQLSPSSSLSSHNTQCKIIVVFVLWPVAESAQKILIFSRLVALFAHAHSNLSSPFALSFLSCACVCTFLDILSVPVTTMPAAVLTNPASLSVSQTNRQTLSSLPQKILYDCRPLFLNH